MSSKLFTSFALSVAVTAARFKNFHRSCIVITLLHFYLACVKVFQFSRLFYAVSDVFFCVMLSLCDWRLHGFSLLFFFLSLPLRDRGRPLGSEGKCNRRRTAEKTLMISCLLWRTFCGHSSSILGIVIHGLLV